MKLKLLCS